MTHHWFGIITEYGELETQLYPTREAAYLYLGWTDGVGGGPGAKNKVVPVTVTMEAK